MLHRWAHNVTAIFPAGGATGELLKQLVDREGISRRAIPIAGDTREDVTVYEKGSGNQFRFVFPGPRLTEAEWRACCSALRSITPRPKFVVLSGSLGPEAPDDLYARIVRLALELGARTAIDTSGAALREALEQSVWLAKPNLRELAELTGKPLNNDAERLAACRELIAAGKVEILAASLGDQGAFAVTREGAWRARAPKIKPVSTVGAGDSFLAAMLLRLAAGAKVEAALAYGVAAGSAALLAPGTELARPADTEKLLGKVDVEEVEP